MEIVALALSVVGLVVAAVAWWVADDAMALAKDAKRDAERFEEGVALTIDAANLALAQASRGVPVKAPAKKVARRPAGKKRG